jgi:hypothetical protein
VLGKRYKKLERELDRRHSKPEKEPGRLPKA